MFKDNWANFAHFSALLLKCGRCYEIWPLSAAEFPAGRQQNTTHRVGDESTLPPSPPISVYTPASSSGCWPN